jgi:hypothetical protein
MIQLTRSGVTGSIDTAGLAAEFERINTFRLPGLVHPDLLSVLQGQLEHCGWSFRRDGELGTEATPESTLPADILSFAANSPAFLETIRQITRFTAIRGFGGRVYRMARSEHRDKWHDDVAPQYGRLVGMSINLSSTPYEGGVFSMRERATEKPICELPNTGPGDAIFFRISDELQHIVTQVESEAPKTAFAGWFTPGESIHQVVLTRPALRKDFETV